MDIPSPVLPWKDNQFAEGQDTKLALDMLSIPAMSAECERTFSSTKVMINSHRNNLSDEVVEASECLRAWFLRKVGVILDYSIDCIRDSDHHVS